MKKINLIKFISLGGVLTTLTVLLQSAPVYLPAFGLAISPLSTIPIALSTVLCIAHGITVLTTSTLILLIVSPQEAIILLFTTGLLGVVLGALLYRRGLLFCILTSSTALTCGMMLLTYVAAIPGFVDLTATFSFTVTLMIFISFSFVYASIWAIFFNKFVNHLIRIKLIEKPVHKSLKRKG